MSFDGTDTMDIFVWAKNYRPPDRYITTSLLWKIGFGYVMFILIIAIIIYFTQNGLFVPEDVETDPKDDAETEPEGEVAPEGEE